MENHASINDHRGSMQVTKYPRWRVQLNAIRGMNVTLDFPEHHSPEYRYVSPDKGICSHNHHPVFALYGPFEMTIESDAPLKRELPFQAGFRPQKRLYALF
jgi:hypothetical protein